MQLEVPEVVAEQQEQQIEEMVVMVEEIIIHQELEDQEL
jgi:hypothetical protein